MQEIRSVNDLLSVEERKKRSSITIINCFVWFLLLILGIAFWPILIVYGVIWLINLMLAEYNIRKIQALGTTVSEVQFPEIYSSLQSICNGLNFKKQPKIIIVGESQVNAFALRFARKKIIVILSKMLEGVVDNPDEVKFFIGHEVCHLVLDHGARGIFEIYKPMTYKSARELTCDNCGAFFAGNLESAKTSLKRLCIGNLLVHKLNEDYLINESHYIYSGFTGWLLKNYLSHPPIGKRIENINKFFNCNG